MPANPGVAATGAAVDPNFWQKPNGRTRLLHRMFLTLVALSVGGGIFAALQLLEPTATAGYIAAAVLVFCFTVLFAWIASNFWLALIGVGRLLAYKRQQSRVSAQKSGVLALSDVRTAVAIPVYNEDPAMVAGGIEAMLSSLEGQGALDGFDFYILSDTTDPDIWLQEEKAWLELASVPAFGNRIFYRRREDNSERKSGNLKQFLENWGHEYRYMLVLDADSVMTGAAMVELVRRMEADSELGLLQTWPKITGGRTLFARMHQYAAVLYGRLLACGMAALINPHGNYWGHNAIVRVDAFMGCCGLPELPGKEPLGGEILSHDFVEAALLVRRGWKVELAADLDGSYEEGPPNIVQHVARDQRWCQGNLQHAWLLLARGIHPVSRINFLTGILAYASSPIWLTFVVVAAAMAFSGQMLFSTGLVLVRHEGGGWTFQTSAFDSVMALSLLGATVTFILAPKMIGAIAALIERKESLARLAVNVLAEMVLSILIAPTVMLRHSIFVFRLLSGRGVKWRPQQRDADRLTWQEAWRAFGVQTLFAAAVSSTAILWPSMVHLWISPILLGLLLSVPIAVLTGRVPRRGPFLLTASGDRNPPEILRQAAVFREAFALRLSGKDPLQEILDSPTANQLRLYFQCSESQLRETDPESEDRLDGALLAKAQRAPGSLNREEKAILLANPTALRRLLVERFLKAEESIDSAGRIFPRRSDGMELSQKCPTEIPPQESSGRLTLNPDTEGQPAPSSTGQGRETICEQGTGVARTRQEPATLRDGAGGESGRRGGSGAGMPAPRAGSARERCGNPEFPGLPLSDATQRPHRPLPQAHGARRGDSSGQRHDGVVERSTEPGGSPALRGHCERSGQSAGQSTRDRLAGLSRGPALRGGGGDHRHPGRDGEVPLASRSGGLARDDRSRGGDFGLRPPRETGNGGRGGGQ